MYASNQVAVLLVFFAGLVSGLLKLSSPSHIWNLPEVFSAQIYGLLVSFCWSRVFLGFLFCSSWRSAFGALFLLGWVSPGTLWDGQIRGRLAFVRWSCWGSARCHHAGHFAILSGLSAV